MKCPKCETDWPDMCGQAVAVELEGHCFACEAKAGPESSWHPYQHDRIASVSQRRQAEHIAGGFMAYLDAVQGEVDWRKAVEDATLTGTGFVRNGKRIDPHCVFEAQGEGE